MVSHVRKWFSVCGTPHAQSGESVIFHLCIVSIVRPIPVRARLSCTQHRRGSDVPLHLPASGRNARSLLLLFCHSLCHLSLSRFFPGCCSSASRLRASTSLWNGLRDLRRGGFPWFVTQSCRWWLGLLATLAIVSIVHGGFATEPRWCDACQHW